MYKVEIANSGDYSFQVKSKDYELLVDIKGQGITPPDALLASLGSCIGVYIRKYAETARLALGAFSITVEAELGKEAPVCFKKIDAYIDLKDTQLDMRRKSALIEFIGHCPVHETLKANPEVVVKFK
ncbi:MAG: OsmC family protein [Candidatus Omnitrophota bacterium]